MTRPLAGGRGAILASHDLFFAGPAWAGACHDFFFAGPAWAGACHDFFFAGLAPAEGEVEWHQIIVKNLMLFTDF